MSVLCLFRGFCQNAFFHSAVEYTKEWISLFLDIYMHVWRNNLLYFRLIRNANLKQKQSKESSYGSLKEQTNELNESADHKKANISDIDEDAWSVCNKIWELIETPIHVENTDGIFLHERLANIQVREMHNRNENNYIGDNKAIREMGSFYRKSD